MDQPLLLRALPSNIVTQEWTRHDPNWEGFSTLNMSHVAAPHCFALLHFALPRAAVLLRCLALLCAVVFLCVCFAAL